MYHDDKQYKRSLYLALTWLERLNKQLPALAAKIAGRCATEVEYEFLSSGSFNCCYRIKGFPDIVRFPILCKSVFRHEKANDECMVMQYLSRYTDIPVPKLSAAEVCDLGPYMVMSFVDGKPLSHYLEAPRAIGELMMLQADIDTTILARAYRRMASILIKLSRCTFAEIGAVGQDETGNWLIKKRPVTLDMNQLVSCGNYPPSALPQKAFLSANMFFVAQAECHINHLRTQRNNAVDDEADCRKKYIARHLFLKIAKEFSTKYNEGPFPLYCDDLRPTNVIVDPDMNVRGVIDWEYCYAAPAEMTYCSPWWLLLTHPDNWPDGDMASFWQKYRPRHDLFIQVLRAQETKMIHGFEISEGDRLSDRMAESLENGHFWFCLAATSSFGFDDIYWQYVDPFYYGELTSLADRINLLSQQEQDEIEPFVQFKMQQAEEEKLDEHWTDHNMLTA